MASVAESAASRASTLTAGETQRKSEGRPLVLARLFDMPSELEAARKARRKAAEAYADAQTRGDTRDQYWTLRRYQRATREELHIQRASRS